MRTFFALKKWWIRYFDDVIKCHALACTWYIHRTLYMSVCMYELFSLSVILSKLEEVTTSTGREFQSRIVAGKNESIETLVCSCLNFNDGL